MWRCRNAASGLLRTHRQAFCASAQPTVVSDDGGAMLEIWAWGKGDAGQLGCGDDSNRTSPQLVGLMEVPRNLRFAPMQGLIGGEIPGAKQCSSAKLNADGHNNETINGEYRQSQFPTLGLACGLFHSALLVDGELWTWGKGEAGRLGLGSEEPKYTLTSNPYLPSVRSVALGGLHSAAITQDGALYTWGFGAFGALGHGRYKVELMPRKLVLGEDENVAYISGGGAHTAAITASGELYTWGRDEGEGRLGHGFGLVTDEGAVNIPLKVYSMPEPVMAVDCGGFFTMALTSKGEVWNWGANRNCELGRGDTQSRNEPSPIPELENMQMIQVACGGYHSAALTEDGRVLTWGRGGDGQLGHGSWDNGRAPRVVEALAGLRVVYIACGSASTAAITDTGVLYCWGKNKDCQLGFRGKMDAENIPTQLTLDRKDMQPQGCRATVAVGLGACHSIGLVLS